MAAREGAYLVCPPLEQDVADCMVMGMEAILKERPWADPLFINTWEEGGKAYVGVFWFPKWPDVDE